MTQFASKSFSVVVGGTDKYREGIERMPCSVEGCARGFSHRGEHGPAESPTHTTDESGAQDASKQTP